MIEADRQIDRPRESRDDGGRAVGDGAVGEIVMIVLPPALDPPSVARARTIESPLASCAALEIPATTTGDELPSVVGVPS